MDASIAKEALNHVPMGIWITDANGKLNWANDAMCKQLGVKLQQLAGKTEDAMMAAHFKPSVENAQLFRQTSVEKGVVRWFIRISQALEGGQQASYWADASEIMRLRNENDQLNYQVDNLKTTDNLTGLLNRRAIFTSLEPQVSRSRRYDNPLAVMVMELRGINANVPEPEALTDQALVSLSYFLRDQLRWVDLIGRIDDKQFLMILPETSTVDAQILAKKLKERMTGLILAADPKVKLELDVAFGISGWQKGDDTALLMRRVHSALENARADTAEAVTVL
ncbi:MAG: sensor domain-containing diguanylate cyclase [Gammaproteobacteria bacterium]|nr:sensor domain-containing diguanylate cyclase [Gammaproteobacteria bacterium]